MSFNGEESSPGGSVPDPANRHWRHPSELAAPAVSAPSATMREAGLGPLVLSGVLAVGAVSGLLVALSVGGRSLVDTGGMGTADSDLAGAAIGQGVDSATEAPAADPTTTTVAAAVTSASLELRPPGSFDVDVRLWSAPAPEPTTDEILLAYGVFASPNVKDRLASYLVHDELVLTSASAVSGRDSIWLRVAGRWTPASVAMADPYTDVAVLETTDPLPEHLVAAELAEGRPESGTNVEVRLGPTGGEAVDDGRRSGVVVAPAEPVKTSLNRHCYDAFSISLHSQVASPGSAVVDGSGNLVGMTISTLEATAAAVPMATVLTVAHSMMDAGSPASVWLGIEAGTDADGRTRVIDVVASGPSDDVLMADDVIVSFDGRTVENPDHLVHLVRRIESDGDAEMIIERDGAMESVRVRPAPITDKG